ncbi:hypothetical protein [Stutzerimonas stutzeri]|uniref:Scaffold protein n=1 Tax=Stutzerimonas stutzeri TaxID=316 RepID=A0A172WRA1_STUST|nr:hypothetical protein [Stutzerimonas stutzeri]ANF26028.1 hypothetical protein PS273GM_13180 [Stutzerimonas stutzeri]
MLDYQRDSLEGLDEGARAFYEEKDGKFQLKVNGIPQGEDVTGLKAKLEELLGESKAAKAKAREAEEAAKKVAEESARKNGDIDALENSWKEKLSKREQELLEQVNGYEGQVKQLTVGRTATELATELAVHGSAKALLPHIQARLSMDIRDGKPTVVVLDANGKPSAATLDELKAEFTNDPAFAPLIVGSKASGSGAGGAKPGGGAANSNPFAKGEGFNLTEQARITRENPQMAAQLKQAASR